MKKAKLLMYLLAAIMLTTTFVSCGDDDDDDKPAPTIFDIWRVTSYSYWDVEAKEMVKKSFDENAKDYELITLTETTFKEEIYENDELTNTVTETLTTVGDLTAVQADGVTGTRVGYTMDPSGEVSQIVLFKDNNSKKFQCKRKK